MVAGFHIFILGLLDDGQLVKADLVTRIFGDIRLLLCSISGSGLQVIIC